MLDTNVVSEVMKPQPDSVVLGWFDQLEPQEIFTTSITIAELLTGVALLPHGQRRAAVGARIGRFLSMLEDQILDFDASAALEYAEVRRLRRDLGRPPDPLDAQIAAIARVHGASVATRNVRDFEGAGVTVVDPWGA
ncbi:type II toxin-antitoxin system VapC family toxin [Herbiconiux liukaitaii]|uniref:type II toxin-antitoxin system VapC family toxin n=1 Tax=Herbiconiux liukaitaii TaxID=3342799 RepID=UPI0035B92808